MSTRVITCADCGADVETKTHNRTVCDECSKTRETARRKRWWKENPTYARDRYHGDIERHRTEAREYQRAREPNERKAEAKARYYSDPEAARERSRQYREANKAKVARYQRMWRARNREAVAEYERRHRETHREQRRAGFQRWRSALHGAEGTFTAAQFVALCDAAGWCCVYCEKQTKSLTADHMVPLSRGGSNSIDNIAPACMSCNCSKGAKTPSEFADWLSKVVM